MVAHIEFGAFGEKIAQKYYERKGYTLLAKNFRIKQYELDLVFLSHEHIVFVEVKTRTFAGYEEQELISNKKLASLKTAIYLYLQRFSDHCMENWELELFSLSLEKSKKPKLIVQPLLQGFG